MAVDLSSLTTEQLMAIMDRLQAAGKEDRQRKDYQRNLGEERQKMMDERGFWENAAAGGGKVLTDAVRGVGQWFRVGPSREEMDRIKALEAPLMESAGGITGQLVGDTALSLAPLGLGKAAQMVPAVGRMMAASPKAEAIAQALNPNTVIGGGALGLGLGAAKPVGTEESRIGNMLLSGGAGLAFPLGVAGYRGVKAAIDPLLGQAGMDRSAGRVLSRFATNPDKALQRMGVAKSNVPGVKPTVGEATLDPGLNTLERSMNNFPGPMSGSIDRRLAENNAARQQFFESLAGTPEQTAAAKSARSSAYEKGVNAIGRADADVNTPRTVQLIDRLLTSPKAEQSVYRSELAALKNQFLEPYPAAERLSHAAAIIKDAVNRAHKLGINPEDVAALEQARKVIISRARMASNVEPRAHDMLAKDALETLYGLETKTKGAQEAVQQVVDLIGAQNVAFKRDPARLAEIYKTINARIEALKAPDMKAASVDTIKALTAVKRSLANSIDRATNYTGASFKEINRGYQKASKEIDSQRLLQNLQTRVSGRPATDIGPAGDPLLGADVLYLDKFVKATDPRRQAAAASAAEVGGKAPGNFQKYLDDRQLLGMSRLRSDSARAIEAANAGKAQGSPTAQFLYAQQLLGEALGPIGLPTSMADKLIGSVTSAPFVGAGLGAMNNIAGRRMAQHMGDVLQDPARAAALMQLARRQDLRMLNPGVTRLLPAGLAGMVSGGMGGMFGQHVPEEQPPYGARW